MFIAIKRDLDSQILNSLISVITHTQLHTHVNWNLYIFRTIDRQQSIILP